MGTPGITDWLSDRRFSNLRVALLALSAIGILSLAAAHEMITVGQRAAEYRAGLEQAIEREAHVRRIATALLEAEASQRGYLLTGNKLDLERFRDAEDKLLRGVEILNGLSWDSDEQRFRANRLAELTISRLRQMAGRVDDRPFAAPKAVTGTNGTDAGLHTTAEERDVIAQMIAFQGRQIDRASAGLNEQDWWSRTRMIALLSSIVVLVAAVLGLGLMYLSHSDRLAQHLRDATEAAERANEAKAEFLATMSHEIRTPLTGIMGYSELLLEERLTRSQRKLVEQLQTAGVGLSAILDGILDFSKIEAGQVTIEREPFSLGALIDNVLSVASVTAQKKGLRVRRDVDATLPATVAGDEPRLRQVLLNLLQNAVKFTSEGQVTLRVLHGETPGTIRFEVIDTGIGIARKMQDRLFRRFSQVDGSIQRVFGGTGLGLAISRKLIEMMDGEIGVESEEGCGACFWFQVPLPLTAAIDQVGLGGDDPSSVAPARILLVEDSVQNQHLVCSILAREGHHVDIANDGEEAIKAVVNQQYDLVIMDMQMPRMDGATATRLIRELGVPAAEIRIIGMTANVLPEQTRAFFEAGIDDHIAKPFRKGLLTEKVNRWLQTGRASAVNATTPVGAGDCDANALVEMRELMGDAWVRASLVRLKGRVEQTFNSNDHAFSRELLARNSHQIVSDAGQLGFHELSRACRELEEACIGAGENLAPALERACAAGRKAVQDTERLLAQMPPPGSDDKSAGEVTCADGRARA